MGRDGAALSGTVLVTGAGGFVGSAVVRALVRGIAGDKAVAPRFADGSPVHRVVALLRVGGSAARLAELPTSPAWTVDHADIADPKRFGEAMDTHRPRAVLHVAFPGVTAGSNEGPPESLISRPLETIFSALQRVPGARVVSTGSVAVLPSGPAMHEELPRAQSPWYPVYSRAKIHEEDCIASLGLATEVAWFHLRLFYTFGRYEAMSRLLPHIVAHLLERRPVPLSSGTQVRDFTDVDEVAQVYVRALAAPDELGRRAFNIGSGRGLSIRAFAEEVAHEVGGADLLRFGTVATPDDRDPVVVADPSRARRDLGWIASADTAARIRLAARWWVAKLQHPV